MGKAKSQSRNREKVAHLSAFLCAALFLALPAEAREHPRFEDWLESACATGTRSGASGSLVVGVLPFSGQARGELERCVVTRLQRLDCTRVVPPSIIRKVKGIRPAAVSTRDLSRLTRLLKLDATVMGASVRQPRAGVLLTLRSKAGRTTSTFRVTASDARKACRTDVSNEATAERGERESGSAVTAFGLDLTEDVARTDADAEPGEPDGETFASVLDTRRSPTEVELDGSSPGIPPGIPGTSSALGPTGRAEDAERRWLTLRAGLMLASRAFEYQDTLLQGKRRYTYGLAGEPRLAVSAEVTPFPERNRALPFQWSVVGELEAGLRNRYFAAGFGEFFVRSTQLGLGVRAIHRWNRHALFLQPGLGADISESGEPIIHRGAPNINARYLELRMGGHHHFSSRLTFDGSFAYRAPFAVGEVASTVFLRRVRAHGMAFTAGAAWRFKPGLAARFEVAYRGFFAEAIEPDGTLRAGSVRSTSFVFGPSLAYSL